ncbi:MAG TPA: ComEC/Rec2 family competence protein [Pyrinomonadaceae bacterium]
MKDNNCRTNLSPLAQLGAAFCTGILLINTELPFRILMGSALLSTFGCALFLVFSSDRAATVALLLAFVFCGGTVASLEMRPIGPTRVKRLFDEQVIMPDAPVEVTGVLQRNVEVSWDALYLILKVEQIRVSDCDRDATGVVSLVTPVPTDTELLKGLQLRYGARIRAVTNLERADQFRNPGVSSLTEYLDRKGYDASASIKSLHLIERLDDDPVFLPLAWVFDWRNQLQNQIDARLSRDTSGVLDAALLGNRYNLSPSTEERFRNGGTFHILVISGLHITLIGGLVFLVIRRFSTSRAVQFLISAAVVWGYSVAVGAEPSILRAALMFTVVMLGPLVSRSASSLNGLGAVAIALLLWKPSSLFDPSFQLTFVSVLAILVLAWPVLQTLSAIGSWQPSRVSPYPPACPSYLRRFAEALYWNQGAAIRHLRSANYQYSWFKSSAAAKLQRAHLQWAVRAVFGAIVVSVSVQITLLPFLIIYFHRFSPASFFLNIFVGVLMAAVAFVALAGVAIAQVNATLAEPLFLAANGLNWLMVHSVDPFTHARAASLSLPEYTGSSFAVYVIYYFPLGVLSFLLMRWRPLELQVNTDGLRPHRRVFRIVACAQLVAVAVVIFHPYSFTGSNGKLRVDFLDVGQGDAALITLPDNTTVLVDGGGRPGPYERVADGQLDESDRPSRSIGESVVSEYLWWRGLDRIDYVVATHADADHMDGLNYIAQNFKVRAGLVARLPDHDPEFAKFRQSLVSNNVAVHAIGAGDELRVGGVLLRVLWPNGSGDSRLPSANDDSLVFQVEYGSRSVLLTGDIEANAERALVARYQKLTADVTKVAHHGSRTSSTEEFVRSTGSKLAIVSVGESSVFGHPHAEVVARWQQSGARVITTGSRGMITLVTDGQSMDFTTFVNR